jgi:hypothetical protein
VDPEHTEGKVTNDDKKDVEYPGLPATDLPSTNSTQSIEPQDTTPTSQPAVKEVYYLDD